MKKITTRLALAFGVGLLSLTGFAGTATAAPSAPDNGPACIGCW